MNDLNPESSVHRIDIPSAGGLSAGYQPSSVDDSVPDPEVQPARDDIDLNFESSVNYNTVILATTSAKVVASALLLFSAQLNCWGSQEHWIVIMFIFDILYGVGLFFKIKAIVAVNSLFERTESNSNNGAHPQRTSTLHNIAINIHRNSSGNSENDVRVPLLRREERSGSITRRLTNKKTALSYLLILGDLVYLVLFVYGQMIYFVLDPDVCVNSSTNLVMLVYLCMGYFWLLLPVVLMTLGCLCSPCLICLYIMLNRGQTPANRSAIKKLKVKEYTNEMPGCPECMICMTEYKLKDKVIQLGCSPMHHFHEKCVKKWLKINGQCPTCRTKLDEMPQSS